MPHVRALICRCCCPIYAEILRPRVVALSIAAIGAAQVGAGLMGLGMPCTFHAVTGLPCPGCGLTRSILALLHGRVAESFWLHPLGLPLFAALATALLAAVMPERMRAHGITWISALEQRTGVCVWVGALLFLIWGVRLAGVLPFRHV